MDDNIQFIDTHAHVYAQAFATDRAQVMVNSQNQHVHKMYMPNIDASTIGPMLAVEKKYPGLCHAMMGIHPCYINHHFEQQLAHAEDWLSRRSFAAIGEIGIDLYHSKAFQSQQEEAFATQLLWALQYQLPVVIHARGSMKLTLKLLEKYQDGNLQGILHCFSGSLQEARRAINLGFYLGVGGLITYKNVGLDQVVMSIALDHLVLETDAPYLSPVPYRGQRNEPAYLVYIADQLATIKQVDRATVAERTTANALKLFKGQY